MTIMLELPRAAPARDRDLLALPPTEELLAAGGDARIDIDPRSATNRYGCPSSPDPAVAAFGSLARHREFLQHVAEQYSGGHRFIDDLPETRTIH